MLESLFFWSYEYMDNAWIGVDIKMQALWVTLSIMWCVIRVYESTEQANKVWLSSHLSPYQTSHIPRTCKFKYSHQILWSLSSHPAWDLASWSYPETQRWVAISKACLEFLLSLRAGNRQQKRDDFMNEVIEVGTWRIKDALDLWGLQQARQAERSSIDV